MRAEAAVRTHLERLAESGASRPTHRQRAWALRQALTGAALFATSDPPADPATIDPDALAGQISRLTVEQLLDPAFIAWFLPWAATGTLAASPDAGRSTASARA